MNLKTARKVVKQLRRSGLLAEVKDDFGGRLLAAVEPNRHPMSGRYVVIYHKRDGGRCLLRIAECRRLYGRDTYTFDED